MSGRQVVHEGHLCDPHQTGEICVRGPQLMKGYFNRPSDSTDIMDKDGFLHTGNSPLAVKTATMKIFNQEQPTTKQRSAPKNATLTHFLETYSVYLTRKPRN